MPIPGTTKLHRLQENLGAVSLQLDAHDLQQIGVALDSIAIVGDRYNAARQKLVAR
ncbi:hypothetical protein D3C81_2322310 [compost metagenome]